MNTEPSRRRIFLAGSIIALALAFGAGYSFASLRLNDINGMGAYPMNAGPAGLFASTTVDFAPFWKTWNDINELYVGEMPSDQEKVWGAIEGLVAKLGDPYSVFFPPKAKQYFESEVRGDFEGVGMEIDIVDGVLTIITPLKGTPAERAGLAAGDRILKIDDTDTTDLSINEAVDLIRGPKGTQVTLLIDRTTRTEPFEVKVSRDVIDVPVVETEDYPEERAFLIRLVSFSATSPDKFREALREFATLSFNQGYTKLILDLRNNPGGYLDAAVDIASWFLPIGDVVVKEDFGEKQKEEIYRSKGYDIFNENLHLVILVNEGSASASEILAGALSKNGVGEIVGEQTFGKGSVQQLIDVTDDTSLKITVARWLLPDDTGINGTGITPDYKVPLTEADLKAGRDPQLQKAFEVLR